MYVHPELNSTHKAARVVCMNHYFCTRVLKLADAPVPEADDAPAGVPLDADAKHKGEIAKLRGTLAWAYMEQHRILDAAELFLTADEVLRFCRSVNLYNVVLQKLIDVDRKHIWRARPKNHGMDHLCITLIRVSRLNPKKCSCLLEEDFLGKMKKIGSGTRGGNCLSNASRILDRYILALSLRWAKNKNECM